MIIGTFLFYFVLCFLRGIIWIRGKRWIHGMPVWMLLDPLLEAYVSPAKARAIEHTVTP